MNLELYPPKEPNRTEYPFTHSTRYKGLDIDIENADGTVRSGVDANGKPWETKFDGAHYGELRGYRGADGDPVDVYIASAPDEEGFDKAFIVHQNFPGNHPEKAGEFDEDKVVLGVRDVDAAKALYLRHYDRVDYLRSVTEMPFDQFITSLKAGDGENKIAGVIAKAFERASAVENAGKATDSAKKKKVKKPTPFIRSHMREGGAVMLKKAYELGVHAALQEVGLEKKAFNALYNPIWKEDGTLGQNYVANTGAGLVGVGTGVGAYHGGGNKLLSGVLGRPGVTNAGGGKLMQYAAKNPRLAAALGAVGITGAALGATQLAGSGIESLQDR